MASRRDLVHSLQFAAQRVVSAMVLRRTDPREWPFRRLGGAGIGTVMVTVVALGAVGIYGMVFPGGKTSWRDGRSVIVDKRTGAAFVYVDGTLHPASNFSSAALIVGSTATTATSDSSLTGVPRGVAVGIAGAPASVPTPGEVIGGPWSLCTQLVLDKAGFPVPRTRLVVGRAPTGGRSPGATALWVTDSADGSQYLVWHDTAFRLADPDVDRQALNLDAQTAVEVGPAWLSALPTGRPIGVTVLTGQGDTSKAVPRAKVGNTLVVTQDGTPTYYLAGKSSIVPISPLQALIQQAAGYSEVPISAATAAVAPKASPADQSVAPPATVPAYVPPGGAGQVVCATYQEGSFAPRIELDSDVAADENGVATTGTGAGGVALADRVWLPPGRAALVEALPSPQATTGALYLVTDAGMRYAVPDSTALRALGLDAVSPSRLPAGLVVRVPEGPGLDPATARAPLDAEQADQTG